jgi:hypothetical protein
VSIRVADTAIASDTIQLANIYIHMMVLPWRHPLRLRAVWIAMATAVNIIELHEKYKKKVLVRQSLSSSPVKPIVSLATA